MLWRQFNFFLLCPGLGSPSRWSPWLNGPKQGCMLALHQSYPVNKSANASVKAGDTQLATVEKFCYLGSFLSNTISVDDDISSRLTKAGCAFGKLQDRLWRVHDVSLRTKIAVYRAVVTTTLLYGCETWTLYRHQVRKLKWHFYSFFLNAHFISSFSCMI